MPFAKITITCSTCGNEFEHRHKCYKSRDIDSYIDWAKSNITLCPDCHRKETIKSERNRLASDNAILRVSYRDYKNGLGRRTVPESYDPATKSIEICIIHKHMRQAVWALRSDDEIIMEAISHGIPEDTAKNKLPQLREECDRILSDPYVIGPGWKLLENYRDQFPIYKD